MASRPSLPGSVSGWISAAEACEHLDYDRAQLAAAIADSRLRSVTGPNSRWTRVREADVRKLLAERRATAAASPEVSTDD
jgi:hypothetical protein